MIANRGASYALAIVLITAVLACVIEARKSAQGNGLMGDFRAFYCAGAVISARQDPYRTHPLYECESAAVSPGFYRAADGIAVPAPLPGYALAMFVPLSKFPYVTAVWVWLVISVCSIIVCAIALMDLTANRAAVVLAALALSLAAISLPDGEVVCIVVAALSVAAAYLHRGKFLTAAGALTVAMIEPHLGLPSILAAVFWVPRTRFPLIVGLALLGALSFSLLGVGANLEYLLRVLPAHALAEVPRDAQFSLAYLLHHFGLSDGRAVLVGEISYATLVGIAVVLCGKLRDAWRAPGVIVALPAAFSVIGGPFIHITQMAAAIPLAMLATRFARDYRLLAITALLGLAVPWQRVALLPALIPLAVLLVGWLTWSLAGARLNIALRTALATAVVLTLLLFASVHTSPASFLHPALRLSTDSLAQGGWAAYVRSRDATGHPIFLLFKLPTWGALLAVMLCCVFSATRPSWRGRFYSFKGKVVAD